MNAEVVARGWDDAINLIDSYQQNVGDFSLAGLPYEEARSTFGQLFGEIEDSARRIQRILTDLKDFVRPNDKANEPFELNVVVGRALRLLGHIIQKRTDVFHLRLADFQLPISWEPSKKPNSISTERERPRHMTVGPGGESPERARYPPSLASLTI